MQAGHIPLALTIATYDWNPKTAVFCLGMHFLPNADSLVVKAGFAKPEFHGTVTHSILFALVVGGIVALFSPHYGIFALVAILAHYAADIGSTRGLSLLWPFSKRKFTSPSSRTRATGAGRCSSATTASRWRGCSKALCSRSSSTGCTSCRRRPGCSGNSPAP